MTDLPSGTVTFLFTDIESSTKLAREYFEIWESLRSRHHQILREAIESNNGFIFQIIGDAFCAAFHTAGAALKAAVKAQQGLQGEAWGECVIRVRMGIHTGEAERHDHEYKGYLTLSLVQRLMSAGHGGQILVSQASESLLRGKLPDGITFRDMGEHKFKDNPIFMRVFQVIAPNLQKDFPALRTVGAFPNNLPAQLTSFIGREKEVADVERLLANARLLTLLGPGGTGKTRLSLQVATEVLHSYPHGVWFIELAPVSDPSSVPATALAALSLPAEVHRPAIDMLCDYLQEKETLLILDNCEHLVEACAKMADRLLHAAPRLRILASSREALGIAGEVSYRVPSLRIPDVKQLPSLESLSQYEAVKLFIDRARAAQPSFNVTNENAPAVAQICHRLDGIPLALELAAAKVRTLNVDQIARRLDDRFRLLTGGSRTALERHQTLRAALDWSHNLLPVNEQVLFRRLSVFVNGWTLEAAESVCSNGSIHDEDILDLLEHLVNKSLVIAEEWHTETRYHMLETMRQYADEKLTQVGEKEALRDRHLEYFLHFAETAEPYLTRPEQLEWLDRLEADHDNLRIAIEWALSKESPEASLRIGAALGMFWNMRCYWKEGARWLERALAIPLQTSISSEKIARARALYQAALLVHQMDDVDRMEAYAKASFALCQETGQRRDRAIARSYLALLAERRGDLKRARRLFEQNLTDFRELKDLYWEAETQFLMNATRGEQTQSGPKEFLLELARKAGERILIAETLIEVLVWAWERGRVDEAEKYLEEMEKLRDQVGYITGEKFLLRGFFAHFRNDYSLAKSMYMACVERLSLLGESEMRSYAVQYLGLLARDEDDLSTAKNHLEESLEVGRHFGRKFTIAVRLALLGQIHFLLGQLESARQNFKESLSIEALRDDSSVSSTVLILIARMFADLAPHAAVQILSSLDTYAKKVSNVSAFPLITRDFEKVLNQTRLHFNESAFQAAWAEGEKMTIDEALDLALKTLDEI